MGVQLDVVMLGWSSTMLIHFQGLFYGGNSFQFMGANNLRTAHQGKDCEKRFGLATMAAAAWRQSCLARIQNCPLEGTCFGSRGPGVRIPPPRFMVKKLDGCLSFYGILLSIIYARWTMTLWQFSYNTKNVFHEIQKCF